MILGCTLNTEITKANRLTYFNFNSQLLTWILALS